MDLKNRPSKSALPFDSEPEPAEGFPKEESDLDTSAAPDTSGPLSEAVAVPPPGSVSVEGASEETEDVGENVRRSPTRKKTTGSSGKRRRRTSQTRGSRRSKSQSKKSSPEKRSPDTSGEKHAEQKPEPPSSRPRSRRKKKRASPKSPPAEKKDFKRLLIDALDSEELRIVVTEADSLEELYFERSEEKKYLGNIYKGTVANLEPAIQAAFVEIGIGRNGFLHVSDLLPVYAGAKQIPIDLLSHRPSPRPRRIQEILQKGQEILVQISKDSIGAKGPSLTTYISIPGKYLVLMPGVSRFGVSKRIQDGVERAKLRESLSSLDPPKGLGYIVRTAGKDKPREVLEKDLKQLVETWEVIGGKIRDCPGPCLIFEESGLLMRALRDFCGPDCDEILINEEGAYQRVRTFLKEIMPPTDKSVRLYTGTIPLFSKFGVEDEIEKIYNRRVPLPNGGYLVIEQTEALVSIDVNSGRFTDEEDLEDTALKTNLEAAQEIARQLRLRDLGGVIVNDFIDMLHEQNRHEVERAFNSALKRDRAKCWVSRISRFGIIEMTRQRVRPSLERTAYEPCKHCRGTGMVKSARTTGTAVLRQLQVGLATRKKDLAEVVVHPEVQSYLLNHRRKQIYSMEEYFQKSITILGNPTYEPGRYTIQFK